MFKSLAAIGVVVTESCAALVDGVKLVRRSLNAGHKLMDVADNKIAEMVSESELDLRKAQLRMRQAEAAAIAAGLIEDLTIEHKPSPPAASGKPSDKPSK